MNNPKLISLISTLINLILAALKLFFGFFAHSIALMADGLHSSLDVISSFVTFLGIRKAQKPADKEHPYGHERYEGLASFVVVLLLFITAGWILYEAVVAVINREALAQFTLWGMIIVAVSVVINEVLARLKFYIGNKFSSLALVADAEHSRADVVSSLAVLVGLFLVQYYPLADSILAILVSLYIFYAAYKLSRETIDSLVDNANPIVEKKIKDFLNQRNISFSEVKTRKIGSSNFAEIFLLFEEDKRLDEVTFITESLEKELLKEIEELKQVSLIVKSHEYSTKTTKSRLGGRFHFRQGFRQVGPAKIKSDSNIKVKRVAIPLDKEEIAENEFGAAEYLIVDVDEQNKIIQKQKVKNPYFEPEGKAHGTKFIKSVSADKVITKHLGPNARRNLEAQNIEIEIVESNKKLNNLTY